MQSSSAATAPPAAAADAAPPSWKTSHSDTDIADRRNLIHEMCVALRACRARAHDSHAQKARECPARERAGSLAPPRRRR
jgi:hypothetical protein